MRQRAPAAGRRSASRHSVAVGVKCNRVIIGAEAAEANLCVAAAARRVRTRRRGGENLIIGAAIRRPAG